MAVAYFLSFHDTANPAATLSEPDRSRMVEIIRSTPRLARALMYTPAITRDPYLDDGPAPQLALQLYFADLPELESALAPRGHLQALAAPGAISSLGGAAATQQAMLVRSFPVPDAAPGHAPGELPCTYLVSYEGAAQDLNEWLSHYISHHAPVMARFPGIREVEICTRIDWCGALPWRRVDHMLRNKVVFDSAQALTAALNSPVRHEMRADFKKFPPFTGATSHYPMATRAI